MSNPWDADPIVRAAPSTAGKASGNPWDADPIVRKAPVASGKASPPQAASGGGAKSFPFQASAGWGPHQDVAAQTGIDVNRRPSPPETPVPAMQRIGDALKSGFDLPGQIDEPKSHAPRTMMQTAGAMLEAPFDPLMRGINAGMEGMAGAGAALAQKIGLAPDNASADSLQRDLRVGLDVAGTADMLRPGGFSQPRGLGGAGETRPSPQAPPARVEPSMVQPRSTVRPKVPIVNSGPAIKPWEADPIVKPAPAASAAAPRVEPEILPPSRPQPAASVPAEEPRPLTIHGARKPEPEILPSAGQTPVPQAEPKPQSLGAAAGPAQVLGDRPSKPFVTKFGDDLHRTSTAAIADKIDLSQYVRDLPPAVKNEKAQEKFYKYGEGDPSAKLTPEEQKIYDQKVMPLKQEEKDLYNELKKLGYEGEDDVDPNYMHRIRKGKHDQFDALGGADSNPILGNRSLSKNTSSLQERKYFTIESPTGTRKVVALDKGELTAVSKSGPGVKLSYKVDKDWIKRELERTRPGMQEALKHRRDLRAAEKRVSDVKEAKRRATIKQSKLVPEAATDTELRAFKQVERFERMQQTLARQIEKLKKKAQPGTWEDLAKRRAAKVIRLLAKAKADVADIEKTRPDLAKRVKLRNELRTANARIKTIDKLQAKADKTLAALKAKKLTPATREEQAALQGRAQALQKIRPGTELRIQNQKWKLVQARTDEIEGATGKEYYKNAIANTVDNVLRLRRAARAAHELEKLKSTPEWAKFAVPRTERAPPGWRSPKLPQLQNFKMDPKIVDVLDDFYGHMPLLGDALAATNRFLVGSLFWNPIPHVLNVAAHWLTARGWDWVKPFALREGGIEWAPGYKSLVVDGARAIRSVVTQDADYQRLLREGSSLLYGSVANDKFYETMMKQFGTKIEKNPERWGKIAKVLGLNKPADLVAAIYAGASRVLWAVSDVFMMQRVLELERRMPTRAAIREAEKHIPNYRVPPEVLGSRTLSRAMQDNSLLEFSRYHYAMFNSYAHMVRDLANGYKNPKEAAEAVGNLMALGVLMYFIYPLVDYGIQKLTGDDKAQATRHGSATLAQTMIDLYTGDKDFVHAIQGAVTLTPIARLLEEGYTNTDNFTGRAIMEPDDMRHLSTLPRAVAQGAEHAAQTAVAPYGQLVRALGPNSSLKEGALQQITGGYSANNDTSEQGKLKAQKYQAGQARARQKKPRGLIEEGEQAAERLLHLNDYGN